MGVYRIQSEWGAWSMSDKNVYQRLAEVRKSVTYLQKGEGKQYAYARSSDVLAAVKEKIDEMGLLLKPDVTGHKVTTRETNKSGGTTATYFTELEMTMTWVNIDDPKDTSVSNWYSQGVDIAGEKGVGKALTYAEKNFILKFFNIPTDEIDPDAFQDKTDSTKNVEEKDVDLIKEKLNHLASLKGWTFNQAAVWVSQLLGIPNFSTIKKNQHSKAIGFIKQEIMKVEQAEAQKKLKESNSILATKNDDVEWGKTK